MNNLVEAHHLVKHYGKRTVVNGIDLVVASGEIVAIIGPNGAGKSTTLEMILGLRTPDDGKITFWTANPRRQIGVQLQSTPFFQGLTALENLQLFATFYGIHLSYQQAITILTQCGLTAVARTEASRLSGGQQKRLAIALALTHQPRLLFLDEPTMALDPQARREIRQLIRTLASTDASIVFTSHDMEEVSKLADRVVLIVEGQVRAEGTPADLLGKHNVHTLEELYVNLTLLEG